MQNQQAIGQQQILNTNSLDLTQFNYVNMFQYQGDVNNTQGQVYIDQQGLLTINNNSINLELAQIDSSLAGTYTIMCKNSDNSTSPDEAHTDYNGNVFSKIYTNFFSDSWQDYANTIALGNGQILQKKAGAIVWDLISGASISDLNWNKLVNSDVNTNGIIYFVSNSVYKGSVDLNNVNLAFLGDSLTSGYNQFLYGTSTGLIQSKRYISANDITSLVYNQLTSSTQQGFLYFNASYLPQIQLYLTTSNFQSGTLSGAVIAANSQVFSTMIYPSPLYKVLTDNGSFQLISNQNVDNSANISQSKIQQFANFNKNGANYIYIQTIDMDVNSINASVLTDSSVFNSKIFSLAYNKLYASSQGIFIFDNSYIPVIQSLNVDSNSAYIKASSNAYTTFLVANTGNITQQQYITDTNLQNTSISYGKMNNTGATLNQFLSYNNTFSNIDFSQLTGYLIDSQVQTNIISLSKLKNNASTLGFIICTALNSVQYSNDCTPFIASSSITNAQLAGSIAYSKLNLSNSIVNADINSSAGILYSKLSLSNGDIPVAKLTSGTDNYVLQVDNTTHLPTWKNYSYTGNINISQINPNSSSNYKILMQNSTSTAIETNFLSNNNIVDNTVDGAKITDRTISISAKAILIGSAYQIWQKNSANTDFNMNYLQNASIQTNVIGLDKLQNSSAYYVASMNSGATSWTSGLIINENIADATINLANKMILIGSANQCFMKNSANTAMIMAQISDANISSSAAISHSKIANFSNYYRLMGTQNSGNLYPDEIPINTFSTYINSYLNASSLYISRLASNGTGYFFCTSQTDQTYCQFFNIDTNTKFNNYFANSSNVLIDVNKINKNNSSVGSTQKYCMISLANSRLEPIDNIYYYDTVTSQSNRAALYVNDVNYNIGAYNSITYDNILFCTPIAGYGGTRLTYSGLFFRPDGQLQIVGNHSNGVGICAFSYGNAYGASSTEVAYINRSGLLIAASDQRRKENICCVNDHSKIHDDILKIELKRYNFKADDTKKQCLGVIAQQLQKLESFQECIIDNGEYLGLDSVTLQMKMLQVLQEQVKINKKQQETIKEQQETIDTLVQNQLKMMQKLNMI